MTLKDDILARAAKQLDKSSNAVNSGEWFDNLISLLRAKVTDLPASDDIKISTNETITVVSSQKDKIVGLGSDAFALFIDKLASGNEHEAATIYLRAIGSVDAIIEAMDQGTLGVIEAKRRLDKMWADAWEIVKTIAIKGAQLLLPLLLAAL
ncbi:hypothetical protein C4588_06490 [Candidatus Parcubacteria bacterium]|nr:MAG: hypothetical protein C4588_06490 [Candidatus Parcubacteria bacterium]